VVVGDVVTWTDLVVGVTAVHKVGAVAVPFAPSFGSFELARLAATCQAVAVLTSQVEPMAGAAPWVASPAELEAEGSARPRSSGQPGPCATLLYASGPLTRPPLVGVVDAPCALPPHRGALVHAFAAAALLGRPPATCPCSSRAP
jgi:non-ribosomal peptide synthetase component F